MELKRMLREMLCGEHLDSEEISTGLFKFKQPGGSRSRVIYIVPDFKIYLRKMDLWNVLCDKEVNKLKEVKKSGIK